MSGQDGDRDPGTDLARRALDAAKAQARSRGLRPGQPGGDDRARPVRRRRARQGDLDTRSGSGPDDRDPQTLDRSLGDLVSDRGWAADAAVGTAIGRWPAIVGPQVAAHSQALSCRDGELVVAADSTAWATQLRLLAPTLLARLATELGAEVVTRITVRGPGSPSWVRGGLRVQGRGPRDTYG